MFDQFTLGIEEEFQIVDPQSRELRSHVTEFLDEGKMILGEQIKPEMIQSMIEVGTRTFRKRGPISRTCVASSLRWLKRII
jgi:glutamate---cysteine ligase / carboxylate-amine ligase